MLNTHTNAYITNTRGTFTTCQDSSKSFIFNSFNSQQSGSRVRTSQGREWTGNQMKFWITPKSQIYLILIFRWHRCWIFQKMSCHFTSVVSGYHALLRVKYWNFRILMPRIFVIWFHENDTRAWSALWRWARGILRNVLPSEKELYTASLKVCSLSLVEVTQR